MFSIHFVSLSGRPIEEVAEAKLVLLLTSFKRSRKYFGFKVSSGRFNGLSNLVHEEERVNGTSIISAALNAQAHTK